MRLNGTHPRLICASKSPPTQRNPSNDLAINHCNEPVLSSASIYVAIALHHKARHTHTHKWTPKVTPICHHRAGSHPLLSERKITQLSRLLSCKNGHPAAASFEHNFVSVSKVTKRRRRLTQRRLTGAYCSGDSASGFCGSRSDIFPFDIATATPPTISTFLESAPDLSPA